MKKQGKYERKTPAGRKSKKPLVIFLCIILVLGLLGVVGWMNRITVIQSVTKWTLNTPWLNSLLGNIHQAEEETKETNEDLENMAKGGGELTPAETTAPEETTEPATEPETTEATEATEPTEPDYGQSGKIVNIMVIGQDFRWDEQHKLADTMMLFTLNKETKKLTVTSFLRDSYVNLPDYYRGHTCGWNRINTAYALGYGWFGDSGAMDMLNVTIQNNYGIEIDGDVEISFDTFIAIVDMLGGLDIVMDEDETAFMNEYVDGYSAIGYKDEWQLHYFEVGENHMNGREALWYARIRHANAGDSDIRRTARQRYVVDLVLEKAKKMSLGQLNSLINEIVSTITTNIEVEDIKMYIMELLPYIFDIELVSNQCPAEGTYWGEMVDLPDGRSGVLKIDFNQNRKLMMEICEG